jgi:hypothetical protein
VKRRGEETTMRERKNRKHRANGTEQNKTLQDRTVQKREGKRTDRG